MGPFPLSPLKIQGNMLGDSPGKRVSEILIAVGPKIHFLSPNHSADPQFDGKPSSTDCPQWALLIWPECGGPAAIVPGLAFCEDSSQTTRGAW